MKEHVRIAGAQIPCTIDLEKNVSTLKDAILWANQNNVDYLVTPEGSLSGYFPVFDTFEGRTIDDLYQAEKIVTEFAASNRVGLCLGTMWGEPDENFVEGYRRENQQRFYNSSGKLLGVTNKTYVIPEYDRTVPNQNIERISMDHEKQNFWAVGLICNDMWGGPPDGRVALPLIASSLSTHIIIHSTNGYRGEDKDYDDLMNVWHEGNLRMWSWATHVPIITVDNCYKMEGTEYHGETSSPSGILLHGKWIVKAPRTGTQYFYYDFDIEKLVNFKYNSRSTAWFDSFS